MAQKVSDSAIHFSGGGRSGRVFSQRVKEDETSYSFEADGVSVTLAKSEDPNRVTRGTLTQSSVPPKRDGKRKHYPRKWRGEEQTGHSMRAAYGHVDEEGVQHEPRVVATRPESWRGTRSPELVDPSRAGGRGLGFQGVKRFQQDLHSVGYHEGTCDKCKEA
jgi:hypothetical protein